MQPTRTFPVTKSLVLTLAATAFACGSTANPSPSTDGGTQADAGLQADAGPGTDGGAQADAGLQADAGPGTDGGTPPAPHIAITGAWDDNFGSPLLTITDRTWGLDRIDSFDNTTRSAITQTVSTDQYNADKYSKQVWTTPANGSFYLCTVDSGLATAAAAAASAKTADATQPDTAGCGGFGWSKMTPAPAIEIAGTWSDTFGSPPLHITSTMFGLDTVISYNNANRTAITQTVSTDMYNPDKFNKVVWTATANGSFYLCTVEYGQTTAVAAAGTTKTADATDPANSGCGGFGWSKMTRAL